MLANYVVTQVFFTEPSSIAIPYSLFKQQVEAGNVAIRHGLWCQIFLDELSSFPDGTKDDQVDALSRAFLTIANLPVRGRRLFLPFNDR